MRRRQPWWRGRPAGSRLSRLGKARRLCLSRASRRSACQFPALPAVPPKLLRNLFLIPVILWALFELICWLFVRFPMEPLRNLDLNNDIAGFKKEVRIVFGDDQVRYLDWTEGAKPDGTVRILCVGGLATLGMLQAAEDTWWGRVHQGLKANGLKVQTAARGFDRTTVLEMAVGLTLLVERLKPDVIVLNAGFDDVIVPAADYVYDPDKRARLSAPVAPSSLKQMVLKLSQAARFKRWWSRDSEAKQMQNQMGRKDVYKKFFEERKEAIAKLPLHEGILRMGSSNDPVQEYLNGLAAMRDLAATHGAVLVLTGEAALHDSVMSHTAQSSLLAYITLEKPSPDGNAPAARPDPAWVMREMDRFASKAESFAADNKLAWVNLNGQVERSSDNFFTDVILTDAGAAAAGAILLPVVEKAVRGGK